MGFDLRIFALLSEEPYADLLQILLQEGELNQKEIAERIGSGMPLLARRLSELESVGLIGRMSSGRSYVVLHPERTATLLRAAADLASEVLGRQAAEAVRRSERLSRTLKPDEGRTKIEPW